MMLNVLISIRKGFLSIDRGLKRDLVINVLKALNMWDADRQKSVAFCIQELSKLSVSKIGNWQFRIGLHYMQRVKKYFSVTYIPVHSDNYYITRMHSSRMLTDCCSGRH